MVDIKKGKEFLDKVEELCREYNISISHEDGHGAFLLKDFDEHYMNWLRSANYDKFSQED